ncbi:DMSO reductase iron-sulfur subunit [Slackia heliotrinireducens]|uniref:Fe-S-cluster-containing hydrogenase subunit n=1 Tax=Slackia heliotrinireducens (strain ATCC 29202 / DSM 20476 / NCTC 11029 / RHS 1) TaxID=471855 RepID=C7N113_SLAHD|nr:4Fe-4S dicluster domain-containing protein [Slackia heliotrinireducens]ACV23235.1 Fe-S-cluster-containing hydrogenase subunit [Slackia heliotrinireducens DSM 20476]VEH02363.1 DMSO reductase iron-sulfur subunit [Slackia heliotrinireducens]
MTQYGMLIDTKRCVACGTCVVGCKVENNLPKDMWYNRVVNVGGENPDSPSGTYAARDLAMGAYTMACQHCSNPACVEVCPTGASWKDTETGLVLINSDDCIGCGACLNACPYDVRRLQEGEPVSYTGFDMGGQGAPVHKANVMEKCTFCAHRVVDGELPFCVTVCPARARIFGDLEDPESEISKKLAEREYEQLLTEAGTEPNVYLLK